MQTEPEGLRQLVTLYRGGSEEYSAEYLAYATCRELGRLRRRAAALTVEASRALLTELQAGEALIREEPLVVEQALSTINPRAIQEEFRRYVPRHPAGEEEDEGLRLLLAYDYLRAVASVARESAKGLSQGARKRLAELDSSLREIDTVIRRHLPAFEGCAPAVNDYCVRWEVEDENPLSAVAEYAGIELEAMIGGMGRLAATLPEAGPECLDENVLALVAEGATPRPEQEAHLASCRRCVCLADILINVSIRRPLTWWERAMQALERVSPSALAVLFKGVKLLPRTAAAVGDLGKLIRGVVEVPERTLEVPAMLTAATGKRVSRGAPVLVLGSGGRTVGHLVVGVVDGPRIERGRFRLGLRFPDERTSGSQAWVAVKLPKEMRTVVVGRVEGAWLTLVAGGFGRKSMDLPLSSIEVAIREPSGAARPEQE